MGPKTPWPLNEESNGLFLCKILAPMNLTRKKLATLRSLLEKELTQPCDRFDFSFWGGNSEENFL
jgi:hypothetical protein